MSLIGTIHTITLTRTGVTGSPVITLTAFKADTFTHEAGFTTATSVTRDDNGDFPAYQQISSVITYVTKVAYPNGSVPATTTTLANLITTASTAITTKFGSGELS